MQPAILEASVGITSDPSEVKLVKIWGSDLEVADDAMVRDPDEEAVDYAHAASLIDGLGRDSHWGCFEHIGATFFIRVPISTARQLMRHRTFHYNEYSLRYKRMIPRFYVPEVLFIDVKRSQLGDSPEAVENSDSLKNVLVDSYQNSWDKYRYLIEAGVRKEQARLVLPLGAFTELRLSGDLRNLMHFLNLRLDPHAQLEARDLGEKMYRLLVVSFPLSMSVWDRYGRGAKDKLQTP
jgi:thymidylate synthase (FAD)